MLIQPFGFNTSGGATGRLLSLGLYYQGGYVIYLTGNYPNQQGLIIAPVEISGAMTWPSIGGVVTPTDIAYGKGFTNTQAAFAAGYTTDGIGTCWNYTNDGFTDWFMPSADELQLVLINKAFIPYSLTGATYHASSAFVANPGNQNWIVDVATATKSTGNHSDSRGVLACRYIT
jgi:hypothetical protein